MERKCRYVPLSKQPLVLVLGQVRFSPIRQIAEHIPAIQENFRRQGFPLERAGKIQQLTFAADGSRPPELLEQQRWEYRNRDETRSILVMQDCVVVQTTAYERFEQFAQHLELALRTVLAKTEHDRFGVVQRVGLRYVDLVQPRAGEDFRYYLRSGFHGIADEVFLAGTHRLHVESIGKTRVGEIDGTIVVRVMQNDQGFDLPPDLVSAAPKHIPRTNAGELVSLIDMDHFIEGIFDPDVEWIVAHAYQMHDHVIETFHNHVVTDAAIEVWK